MDESEQLEEEEHSLIWASFCHLAGVAGPPFGNILGPLAIWLVTRRFYPYVNDHGKEAVNFQIWMSVYFLVSIVLTVVLIGLLLLPLVWLASIIFAIVAAVKANRGQPYRYPLVPIRFIS